MTKVNKILLGFFIVLLLLVLSEIGYYFYYQSGSKTKSSQMKTVPVPTTKIMIPYPTAINKNIKSSTGSATINSSTMALDKSAISFLQRIKKGILTSSTLINEYQGKISVIDLKGSVIKNITYPLKLTIMTDNGVSNTFYLDGSDFANVKVKTIDKTGKLNSLAITDLKVNDKVKIQHTIDLLKKSLTNTVEFTIIRL